MMEFYFFLKSVVPVLIFMLACYAFGEIVGRGKVMGKWFTFFSLLSFFTLYNYAFYSFREFDPSWLRTVMIISIIIVVFVAFISPNAKSYKKQKKSSFFVLVLLAVLFWILAIYSLVELKESVFRSSNDGLLCYSNDNIYGKRIFIQSNTHGENTFYLFISHIIYIISLLSSGLYLFLFSEGVKINKSPKYYLDKNSVDYIGNRFVNDEALIRIFANTDYFLLIDGVKSTPLTLSHLRENKVSPDTLIWRNGLSDWIEASKIRESKLIVSFVPPTKIPTTIDISPKKIYEREDTLVKFFEKELECEVNIQAKNYSEELDSSSKRLAIMKGLLSKVESIESKASEFAHSNGVSKENVLSSIHTAYRNIREKYFKE